MAENLERQSLIWPLRSIIEHIDLNDLFHATGAQLHGNTHVETVDAVLAL